MCLNSRVGSEQGCPGRDPLACQHHPHTLPQQAEAEGLPPAGSGTWPTGFRCTTGNTCLGQPSVLEELGSAGPGSESRQGEARTDVTPLILCPAPAACSCPPSLLLLCQQPKLPWCQQTIETYLGAWQSLPSSTLGQHRARALCACLGSAVLPGPGCPSPAGCYRHQPATQAGCVCLARYMCLPCRGHTGPACHSLQS